MRRHIALRATVVLVLLSGAVGKPAGCGWTDPISGAQFDLSALRRTRADYVSSSPGYKYFLNVCADVVDAPPGCDQGGAPGFQVFEGAGAYGGQCKRLGASGQREWSLIDAVRPAGARLTGGQRRPQKGVVLKFGGGDACGQAGARQLAFHFICAHTFGNLDQSSGQLDYLVEQPLFVSEHQTKAEVCHYNVTWPTVHGCPASHQRAIQQSPWLVDWQLLVWPGLSTMLWAGLAWALARATGCLGGQQLGKRSAEYASLIEQDGL